MDESFFVFVAHSLDPPYSTSPKLHAFRVAERPVAGNFPIMSVFLLILGSILFFDFVWLGLSDWFLRKAGRGRSIWRILNALFLAGQLGGLGAIIFARSRGFRQEFSTWIMSMIYLWHLLMLPLLLVLGVVFLIFGLLVFLKRLVRKSNSESSAQPAEAELAQTRRQFIFTAATIAPPLCNLALTGFSQSQIEQFRVREITLSIKNLPTALNGMTIAHVSDLHVGPFTSEKVIWRVAKKVNDLRCDLILLTGDLINSKLSELPLGMDFVRSLDSHYGVAMIEGNHDLFEGRAAFDAAARAGGVDLLVNDSKTVRVRDWPVQLLGLRWGGLGENPRLAGDLVIQDSMKDLLTKRDMDGAFPILLAHHPHAFDSAAAAGLPLTLSGHTHGGQLMLNPQLGAGPLMFRYWSGLYQHANSQLIVSNGVGNWFPLRTAAPAEIIKLTLVRDSSSS